MIIPKPAISDLAKLRNELRSHEAVRLVYVQKIERLNAAVAAVDADIAAVKDLIQVEEARQTV
jgi:hypothetical protein